MGKLVRVPRHSMRIVDLFTVNGGFQRAALPSDLLHNYLPTPKSFATSPSAKQSTCRAGSWKPGRTVILVTRTQGQEDA